MRANGGHGRLAGDEGAALIEAAIVSPVLFLFLMGIMEYGLLFKDYLTLSNGLRAGARMAAVAGNSVDADYRIVQAVKSEMLAISPANITKVVVFKANGLTDAPSACKSDPVHTVDAANHCNNYDGTNDWSPVAPAPVPPNTPASNYDCVTRTWANGWCPTSRLAALTANGTPVAGPPDYVGIYIVVQHAFLTGFFGSAKTLTGVYITQIEPKVRQ
jgi:Flp pilus assembly protein TadG